MPTMELIRGPALASVGPDDAESLVHLAREQRARVETIREQEIWNWLGGELGGLHRLWPLYGLFVFMALVPITAVVAGFTLGPVLWVSLALTVLSLLPYLLLELPDRARTRRLLRSGELRPAFVLTLAPELEDPEEKRGFAAHLLVGPELGDPARLRAHSELAARISSALAGHSSLPGAESFLADLRRRIDQGLDDGSRTPLPPSLGVGMEVAHVRLWPRFMPDERVSSRLLFVCAVPERRGTGSTRVVQSNVWGEGADSLCAAFPREAR